MATFIAKDLIGTPLTDWAKLAAFIDSEGHIRVVSKKQKVKDRIYQQEYLEVTVCNTSPLLMQWLTRLFGGSVQPKQRRDGDKPAWLWYVAARQASTILQGCLPHFVIKRDQADLALAFYATMKRYGVKGTPDHIRAERHELRTKLRVLTARGLRADAAVNE